MQCPQCGAPVEAAPGHPLICHFCNTAVAADAHTGSTESFQHDTSHEAAPAFDQPLHTHDQPFHEAQPFHDATPARATVSPVVPRRSSSTGCAGVVIAIVAIAAIAAALGLSRCGRHHGGHRGRHAASGDQQKP